MKLYELTSLQEGETLLVTTDKEHAQKAYDLLPMAVAMRTYETIWQFENCFEEPKFVHRDWNEHIEKFLDSAKSKDTYDTAKDELTEAQFDLFWYICAEGKATTAPEDFEELQAQVLADVKGLSDMEAIEQLQEELS